MAVRKYLIRNPSPSRLSSSHHVLACSLPSTHSLFPNSSPNGSRGKVPESRLITGAECLICRKVHGSQLTCDAPRPPHATRGESDVHAIVGVNGDNRKEGLDERREIEQVVAGGEEVKAEVDEEVEEDENAVEEDDAATSPPTTPPPQPSGIRFCANCGARGHLMRDCPGLFGVQRYRRSAISAFSDHTPFSRCQLILPSDRHPLPLPGVRSTAPAIPL